MISSCSRWMVATMSRMHPGPGPLEGGQERTGASELELDVSPLTDRPVVPAPVAVGLARSTRSAAAPPFAPVTDPNRSSSTPTIRRP